MPFLRYSIYCSQNTEKVSLTCYRGISGNNRTIALQSIHESSEEFMSRFIAFFEGEKDPRNLMIVFSILNVPMVEWDVSAAAKVCFVGIHTSKLMSVRRIFSKQSSITFQLRSSRHQMIPTVSQHNSSRTDYATVSRRHPHSHLIPSPLFSINSIQLP